MFDGRQQKPLEQSELVTLQIKEAARKNFPLKRFPVELNFKCATEGDNILPKEDEKQRQNSMPAARARHRKEMRARDRSEKDQRNTSS